MTPLDQIAASLLDALGAAAVKATLLLALGAGATVLLRRRSAALRHAVWTIGLGATMALLALPAMVPAWQVIPRTALNLGGGAASTSVASVASAAPTSALDWLDRSGASEPAGAAVRLSSREVAPPAGWTDVARRMTEHWPLLLAVVWLTGAIVVLARHFLSVLALHRLCRRAPRLGDPAGAGLGRRLAADLHIGRTVTFLSSDDIEWPLTWGVVFPRVVLPGHAGDWHVDRLRVVLQHELAHVKRFDAGTQLVARVACATFWFHPLVWHATRQMRHERERACDDRVLAQGVVPSVYASDLLALVDTCGPTDRHHTALAMARRSTLEGRLLALLDPTIEHGTAPLAHLAIAFLLAIVCAVPAAALRAAPPPGPTPIPTAVARSPRSAIDATAPASTTETVSPAPQRGVAERLPVGDLFDGCLADGRHGAHDSRNPVNGQMLWTASAQSGDCIGELTAHGDITFNRDVTAIEHISDQGDIAITTTMHGATTRLVARVSDAGSITYAFARNGQPADFDADGRMWLASFLTMLDRRTAFAVDQRLPLLIEAGGASRALDEIDRMRTEHARMTYLVALVGSRALTASELDRAMTDVRRLTSDHARLEGLLALTKHNRFEGARLDAYLNAAADIQSVGGRRRAIAAVGRR